MAKRKGNLLRQLTLSLGLAIVFLSLASFYYQYRVEKHILMGSIQDDLVRQANLVRAWLMQAPDDKARKQVADQYIENIERLAKSQQEVVVFDADGELIAKNADYYDSQMLLDAMRPGAPREGRHRQSNGFFEIALPYYADTAGTRVSGAVLLRHRLTVVDELVDSLMLGAFLLLAATLVIIVIVVYVVLRRKVHQPMQAIFMQEYRIREGDLAKIDAEDPQNEFSDLYAMYNEMVDRIAEQKRAMLAQKDHVALADLVRQTINKLTGPLDEITTGSQTLLEHASSLAPEDRQAVQRIINNVTRIARELKSVVVEGSRSQTWLKREAEKIRDFKKQAGDDKTGGRHVIG